MTDRFEAERGRLAGCIEGAADAADRERYAGLLLHRLMFLYFLQAKGPLAAAPDYLRNGLRRAQVLRAAGAPVSYYRDFLIPVFHDDLAGGACSGEIDALRAAIPRLGGGLFAVHRLERECPRLTIADEAFEQVFDCFDAYRWRLDDGAPRAADEVTPDVFDQTFAQHVNQKQTGAYYTGADVAEYVVANTVLPALFEAAATQCPSAFGPNGSVWALLREQPDCYLPEAVRQGVDEALPEHIAAGLADVSCRARWDRVAAEPFGLQTETWREHIARRARCQALRGDLAAGAARSADDLVTGNLDRRRLAHDAIARTDRPEVLRAFWHALVGEHVDSRGGGVKRGLAVLDPTCGPGAFLVAALRVLEPLYEACLERMARFVDDAAGSLRGAGAVGEFERILARVEQQPRRRYFCRRAIVASNLYGVDLAEEAVEVCRLRLGLALVAALEDADTAEPLPDLSRNVRAGNALIGFARRPDAARAPTPPADEPPNHETAARASDDLDQRLAGVYGVDARDPAALARWRASHRPLHWAAAFPTVMAAGGFDAIVGNPPYVEYHRVKSTYTLQGYTTESCGNLYAYVVERALALLAPGGRAGLIVPISLVGTERMAALRACVAAASSHVWTSHYDVYPSKLFARAKQRLTILLLRTRTASGDVAAAYSTRYNRWYPAFRPHLMATLQYWRGDSLGRAPWLKLGSDLEWRVWRKLARQQPLGAALDAGGAHPLLVHRIPYNFVKAITFTPYFHSARDGAKKSEDYKPYCFRSRRDRDVALAALSSSLFFWYWYARYEGYHCGRHEIAGFPLGLETMSDAHREELSALAEALVESLRRGARRRRARYAYTGMVEYDELYPRRSKPLLDQIDRVLAEHYGLAGDELDFIVHHDLKYRMGLPGPDG